MSGLVLGSVRRAVLAVCIPANVTPSFKAVADDLLEAAEDSNTYGINRACERAVTLLRTVESPSADDVDMLANARCSAAYSYNGSNYAALDELKREIAVVRARD